LAVVRHYLSSAVGDLIYGQCDGNGQDTSNIYAPFLWQPDDFYNEGFYEVYVYAGTNIGVTKRVTDWVLSTFLLTVHSAYTAACDDSSYIELHRIFSEDEYRKAINLAIESLAGKYLVDIIDDTTIPLVADTYEYALPTSLLYLHKVTTEHAVAGDAFYNSDVIDPRDWSIIKAYPPYLKLDKRHYSITAGKDLRLEGQGTQPLVTADTNVIYLPPGWLKAEAILNLPQNKIQSNQLDGVYAQAQRDVEYYRRTGRNYPEPTARRIVE